jgi:hypothetical protein
MARMNQYGVIKQPKARQPADLVSLIVPTGTKDSLSRIVGTFRSQYDVRAKTYQKRPPSVDLRLSQLAETNNMFTHTHRRYISDYLLPNRGNRFQSCNNNDNNRKAIIFSKQHHSLKPCKHFSAFYSATRRLRTMTTMTRNS